MPLNFADEYESEEEIYADGDESEEEEGMEVEDAAAAGGKAKNQKKAGAMDAMEEEGDEEARVETKVWRPGVDELAEGEGACVRAWIVYVWCL